MIGLVKSVLLGLLLFALMVTLGSWNLCLDGVAETLQGAKLGDEAKAWIHPYVEQWKMMVNDFLQPLTQKFSATLRNRLYSAAFNMIEEIENFFSPCKESTVFLPPHMI